jgi:diketogulonate reductase-like aldo/keto reductase
VYGFPSSGRRTPPPVKTPRSPDLHRLERHLHVDEMESVREWCRRQGVPVESWAEQAGTIGWQDLAIGRAVDEALRTGRARSYSAALRFVGADFGMDGDSIRRRWGRRRAA